MYNFKYFKILVILIVVFILFKTLKLYPFNNSVNKEENEGNNVHDLVKITVYYEALCPDSKFFILHQLVPVYKNLLTSMILDLVPYGKAETFEEDGDYKFRCQHDAVECYANKIHSCVINKIKEPYTQLQYIACMIDDNIRPDEVGQRCGNELNIPFEPIKNCAKSKEGSLLLKSNGVRTHSLSPAVKFIPTIELNESQNIVPQSHILKDLIKAVCQLLKDKPNKCSD
ncbi:unnamed protein product [Brassicogethes aeneus]|uniref:Gamma-interferon-inducible lysosomal thiol reductase n=1 Tax=Brassicogethes aeneus TaxID=1431903 RepID=A0A9P0FLH8_BRAAE|nr:unnamed protein product [Brassicogethes aeneus]